MRKITGPKLTANELAHYTGSDCYFNNGRIFMRTKIKHMLLYEYDKGGVQQVFPILRKINAITHDELLELSKQPFYVDGFALNCVKKFGGDLFNFHLFVTEWGAFDVYMWLMQHGFDIWGWIEKGKAFDAEEGDWLDEYSVDQFNELFL